MIRIMHIRLRLGGILALVAIVLATITGVSSLRASTGEKVASVNQIALAPTVKYVQKSMSVPSGGVRTFAVNCPTGYSVLGGGYASSLGNVLNAGSYPTTSHHGWGVALSNVFPQVRVKATLTGYAICARSLVPVIVPRPR